MPYNSSQVYQPDTDTYLLLNAARAEVKPGDRVLEVGTGSGIIAAELAGVTGVIATDINPHAGLCAREKGIDVIRNNLFSGIRSTFDLILFNPPYLPTLPNERMDDWIEFALDGGPDGRSVIRRFLSGVSRVLAPGGRCLLLVSSLTGIPEVFLLVEQAGFTPEVFMEEQVEGEMLMVIRFARVTAEQIIG